MERGFVWTRTTKGRMFEMAGSVRGCAAWLLAIVLVASQLHKACCRPVEEPVWFKDVVVGSSEVRGTDARDVLSGKSAPPSPPGRVQGCKMSVVGAGYGGIYFAYRLVLDEGIVDGRDVCFFEGNPNRIGGRIYSIRNLPLDPKLVVDVGGYRFPTYHKLMTGMMDSQLGLNSSCYSPLTCEDELRLIADESGLNAIGYITAAERMLQKLIDAGTRVFYGYKLTQIMDVHEMDPNIVVQGNGPKPVGLTFENGGSAVTNQLMLNIPKASVSSLHHDSILFTKASKLAFAAYNVPQMRTATKVYAHYKDAWWITKLGLLEGDIMDGADPMLYGRYHDGHVRCFDKQGEQVPVTTSKGMFSSCSGLLLVAYFGFEDPVREMTYTEYKASEDPLTIIGRNDTSKGVELLKAVHNHLMTFHEQKFADAGYKISSIDLPEYLYMANWEESNTLTGTYHYWPRVLPGIDRAGTARSVLRPVPGYDIFLANEGYGVFYSWAEGSLVAAERVLAFELGVQKPIWLQNDTYYSSVVQNFEYYYEV